MASMRACRPMPCLPAGFRFHPTDEELIVHYLMNQAAAAPCPVPIIAEVNIYHCNPWDLPPKALFGESEWYFFSPRERKYPNGARPNRAAGSGYWKATGTDKAIVSSAPASQSIGVKKALVFYRGKPPRGVKTDWVMHEYRLTPTGTGGAGAGGGNNDKNKQRRSSSSSSSFSSSSSMRLDDWVLCRIYKKSSNNFQLAASDDHEQDAGSSALEVEEEDGVSLNSSSNKLSPRSEEEALAASDQQLLTPPPPPNMSMSMSKSCSLTDLLSTIDYSTLSQLLLDAPPPPAESETHHHTTTPACQPPLVLNNNSSATINGMMPQLGVCAAGYNNNNTSLKRKRVMTTDQHAASSSSSDAFFFFGGGGYYCNQQLAEAGGSSSFQCTSLTMNQQALLLHSHIEMQ